MKKISILIPCYNETENVIPMYQAIRKLFREKLTNYEFELIYIDNCSIDGTKDKLRKICAEDDCVKAIFNMRNFGQNNSPYYGLLQTGGDCSISMSCDFQDPVELIPSFVEKWESGAKVVCAIKKTSKENKVMFYLRSLYYKLFKSMSEINMIEHFTGFGLYDRSIVEILRKIDDSNPFFRGLIAEYGMKFDFVEFEQPKRKYGKTHNNFSTLYSIAMRSFTNYTDMGIRMMTLASGIGSLACILLALIIFVLKVLDVLPYIGGIVPIVLLICLLGFMQLTFLGIIGEYLINLKKKIEHRPLVIEEERINFNDR